MAKTNFLSLQIADETVYPRMRICVNQWTREGKNVFLTSECVSVDELRRYLAGIRDDLKKIESQAQEVFARRRRSKTD